MQTPAGGDLLVTNPPAILPCSLPQWDLALPQRWGWGWASTSPAAGPPRDHHRTPAADQPRASHLCHLPAPPWPRSVAFHEPLARPQRALGQRAVATEHFGSWGSPLTRKGSRQGTSAWGLHAAHVCQSPVPQQGAVTPRGLQGRRHSTRQGPHRTPQLQTQLARASSLVMAACSSLPFLHAGSPHRAELFTATNPPWYSHRGEKAGGWGRRLALLGISPRPPRQQRPRREREGWARLHPEPAQPQLRPEALAARMKKTSRDTTPVTSSRPCRAFPRLGDQTHQARKPGAASSSRTPCSSVLGVGGTKQHQGWGSPRVLSPRSAPRMEQRCWEGNLRADLKLGCGQKHTGAPQGGGCPPEGMGPPHAAWLHC